MASNAMICVMKFYLFVSYLVWIFGAFTIIFVLSHTTQNILIASIILLTTSSFLIYLFHQVTTQYTKMHTVVKEQSQQIKKLKQKTKNLDTTKIECITIATTHFKKPILNLKKDIQNIARGAFGKVPVKFLPVLENMTADITKLSQSIEKYFTAEKILSDTLPYNMSDFNIKDLSEELVDTYRKTAMRSGVALHFKSDIDHKGIIHADREKTKIILTGLLENALACSKQGEVFVYISDNSEHIQIHIQDSGYGYTIKEIDTIFDKYHHAHLKKPVDDTYTGLELYTANELAKNMGGAISAISDGVNTGATFTVTFPVHL